jgi:SAM-dependent MidA family methyltransferase
VSRPLIDLIVRDGPVRFDDYMAAALYHPEYGYYSSGVVHTGFRGHFVTSPELTPAFGALWARAFEQVWVASAKPRDFVVTEIGAGEGGFGRAVLANASTPFRDALRYRIVEPIPKLRERQRASLGDVAWTNSVDELETVPSGVVFANEVLDNLPVRIVEGTPEGPREIWVKAERGKLVETHRALGEDVHAILRSGIDLPPGHRLEIPRDSMQFVKVLTRSVERGALFFVDYGADAADLRGRPLGSLLCYSATGVDDRPLDRPGEKDITVHANWTLVSAELTAAGYEVSGPLDQRVVLDALGAGELAQAYKAEHDEALQEGRGADAVRALSSRSAIGALRDGGGLGGLGVLAGFRGIAVPPAFAKAEGRPEGRPS